jgi:hypothetical protein
MQVLAQTLPENVFDESPQSTLCHSYSQGHSGSKYASRDAASHCGFVYALTICGSYLISASGDSMIKVWLISNGSISNGMHTEDHGREPCSPNKMMGGAGTINRLY